MLNTLSVQRISNHALKYVLAAQLICLLPLFFILPKWLPVLWVFACVWRIQIIRDKWTLPHWLIKATLAAACMGGLYVSYGFNASIEPLIGFLLAAAILKIIEAQKNSDAIIVLFVCFVLVATQLLFSQSLLALLYSVASIVVVFMALNALFKHRISSIGQHVKPNVIMVLQVVPIACLLFVVLPRLPPLWSMPSAKSAATGFSDSMSPGDISALSKSSKVAFRVTLYDADRNNALNAQQIESVLPSSQRYWRGLVLDAFENNTWSRSEYADILEALKTQEQLSKQARASSQADQADQADQAAQAVDAQIPFAPRLLHYDVLLEPHSQRWLFSLYKIHTIASSARTKILPTGLVKSFRPVSARMQYSAASHLYRQQRNQQGNAQNTQLQQTLSQREKVLYTTLPSTRNNQADALARKLSGGKATNHTRDYINAVLAYYNQSFTYTLNPPRLGVNSIDDFLFVSKRGFCEHFSSSFVYLMRAAGLPARVVVGYLGGEINPVENYMVVKQSDAHAWAEVWITNQGWVRVDPTSAVAPQRIEQSLSNALTADEQRELQQGLWQWGPLRQFANRIDAASYLWHRYVVSYDNSTQKGFFSRFLGGEAPWRIAAFVCAAMIVLILTFFVLPLYIKRKNTPPDIKLLFTFEKKCRVLAMSRAPSQSPAAFAQHVAKQYPRYHKPLMHIAALFESRLYAPSNTTALAELKVAIHAFKPQAL